MGVGSSIQNQSRVNEPPPLPPPFYSGSYISEAARVSTTSDEEGRIRSSFRNDELWQPRPSTSLRQPQEALLTYATQMTGWPTDYSSNPTPIHQETMELAKIISHLAAANEQLATAQNVILNQFQSESNLRQRIEVIENIVDKNSLSSGRGFKNNLQSKRKESDDNVNYPKTVERINISNSEDSSNDDYVVKNIVDDLGTVKKEKFDYSDVQKTNKKLKSELDKQKKIVDKIKRDNEISNNYCEKIEIRLSERKKEYDILSREYHLAKVEMSKLREQLDVFYLEKEKTKNELKVSEETISKVKEENVKLRVKINEEVENKKKLSESLKEIQKLNEIIDSMRKDEKSEDREGLDSETAAAAAANENPSLEEFKKNLSLKREARQRAIAAVSSEMERLRRELDAEKEAHSETSRVLELLKAQAETPRKSETFSVGITANIEDPKIEKAEPLNSLQLDAQRLTDVLKVSDQLGAYVKLQIEKIDDFRYHLECEPEKHSNRIKLLKNVASVNKEAYSQRERQIHKLKSILSQILARLGDDKFRIDITDDLRLEYDHQLEDIKRLKSLYDERLRVLVDLKDSNFKELTVTKEKLSSVSKEKEVLDDEVKKNEEKIDLQGSEISNLESQLGLARADCRDFKNQISVINSLFSQMLLSASSADIDLDRLTQLLQENHDLISEMAREEGTEAAALPKLLLDIIEQVEGHKKTESDKKIEEEESQEESIANNLPKVWRVLFELLSCHAVTNSTSNSSPPQSASLITDPNSCYKSIDTPTGPRLVISVSKTYIRLKELILEKKQLEKEMGRLKQLNSHLESKLGEQEKRLSTVSVELSKTWNIVGRMQAQHQQLHTHEKILRYELQQKRIMLQELKQELEYCREKWESARQKNTNTEMEWRILRREFAARKSERKSIQVVDSLNNSTESGFSDERGDESDDIPSEEERVDVGLCRRIKNENSRVDTPDSESEQIQLDEQPDKTTNSPPEITDINSDKVSSTESLDEKQNPIDEALANVIQNLIQINHDHDNNDDDDDDEDEDDNDESKSISISQEADCSNFINSNEDAKSTDDFNLKSVFSIGPLPTDFSSIKSGSEIPLTTSQSKDETVKENGKGNKTSDDSMPSTSSNSSKVEQSHEEVLAARASRLKRLEEQADWLMKKMNATNRRGSALSNRLEELHEVYGEPPTPPPLPDVLPSIRLPTSSDETTSTDK